MSASHKESELQELANVISLIRLTNYAIGQCFVLGNAGSRSLILRFLVCCFTFICYDIALNIALEVNQGLNHCPTTCVDDMRR